MSCKSAINARTEALQTAFHAVSEAMYQKAQADAAASADGGSDPTHPEAADNGASAEEDVVDAEVVDEGKS